MSKIHFKIIKLRISRVTESFALIYHDKAKDHLEIQHPAKTKPLRRISIRLLIAIFV